MKVTLYGSKFHENVTVVLPHVSFKTNNFIYLFLLRMTYYKGKMLPPFERYIIQQLIMSMNRTILPMTELSDPPSYK